MYCPGRDSREGIFWTPVGSCCGAGLGLFWTCCWALADRCVKDSTLCNTLWELQEWAKHVCPLFLIHTEGGIFDATVCQSPKTSPKQTQTGSKTAHNSSKRVSKKYPREGRAFGKTFNWGISSDFMQKMVRKWRFFIFLKFCWKMLRIGLTCIVR